MRRSTITIGGYPSDAVEERQENFLLRQNAQDVTEGGQDSHSRAPAIKVPGAKQRGLAQNLQWGHASHELTLHGLCYGEPKIVGHANFEPLPPIIGWLRVPEIGLDPHLPTAHLDRAGRDIVGPEIERAATRKIKPGMVPVAGENAVLNASAIEGEPHMRAPVVKGVNSNLVSDDQDGSMRPAYYEPSFVLEFRKRACTYECSARGHASSPSAEIDMIPECDHVMGRR
jgi:hypothetical protein